MTSAGMQRENVAVWHGMLWTVEQHGSMAGGRGTILHRLDI